MNNVDYPCLNEALPDDAARVVRSSTLINHLAELCRKARHAGGSAFPPAVCWVLLDETISHRDQIGFSGLEKLMRAIHERIRVQLGPADVTARFGLDAIAIVLDSHAGERDYVSSGTALIRAISNHLIEVGDQVIAATVSIATQPVRETLRPSEMNLVAVARFAERLTEHGGNRSRIMDSDAGADSEQPASLLGQLSKALRDDTLKVVFQPLLATTGPERERAHMLPRLTGPDGSLIPAARFVPIAAKRGVLPALDNWMVGHAIRLMTEYQAPDPAPQYFLTQSPALIDDPKFLEWLCGKLETLTPNQNALVLEFNILEIKPRIRVARTVFERLREKGVGIAELCFRA
ncbi:MAG: EAL domain-containing protein [Xanthomonadaceae bacterium]|nr:EAL domain-containing protein [Xanthomonadaceae bacterium]